MGEKIKVAIISGIFSLLVGIITTFGVTSSINNQVTVIVNGEKVTVNSEEYQNMYVNLKNDYDNLVVTNADLIAELNQLKQKYDRVSETNSPLVDKSVESHSNIEEQPTYIKNIEPFVGKVLKTFDAMRDNLGNNHFNAVGGYNQSNAYVTTPANNLYLINGEYSRISGQLFLRENGKNTNKEHVLEIYGDDQLLYNASVTGGVKPIDFNIDIKGVIELRVVIDGNDTIYAGTLAAIDNFALYK